MREYICLQGSQGWRGEAANTNKPLLNTEDPEPMGIQDIFNLAYLHLTLAWSWHCPMGSWRWSICIGSNKRNGGLDGNCVLQTKQDWMWGQGSLNLLTHAGRLRVKEKKQEKVLASEMCKLYLWFHSQKERPKFKTMPGSWATKLFSDLFMSTCVCLH